MQTRLPSAVAHLLLGSLRLRLTIVGLLITLSASSGATEGAQLQSQKQPSNNRIVLTIVCDNNPGRSDLSTAWGFSCLIEGLSRTILFDTGRSPQALLGNMKKLGLDPGKIDVVVLSHIHGDHVGGLCGLLAVRGFPCGGQPPGSKTSVGVPALRGKSEAAPGAIKDITVFMPAIFPAVFKRRIRGSGAMVVETTGTQKVCEGAWTTGVLAGRPREEGLCVETGEGIVVITGCAHPGVVNMVKAAKERADENIFAVLGGFHMGDASETQIKNVIGDLRKLGVIKVGPCHCSGSATRIMMKDAFGHDYIPLGVGSRIELRKSSTNASDSYVR